MNRVFLSILLLSMCQSVSARIIRVAQTGDGTDGSSWETAYQTISGAVTSATPGDSIWVMVGTYGGSIVVDKKLKILGGFVGDETDNEEQARNPITNKTIIDGGESAHGLMGCVTECIIDGFVMRNAGSTGLIIYNGSNATISRCRIEGNFQTEGRTLGGGVAVIGATPNIIDCEIIENKGTLNGGGIEITEYSTVNMKNCIISNNKSYSSSGGGIACLLSSITMDNCIVTNNRAIAPASEEPYSEGGGVVIDGNGNYAVLRNCLIVNNYATEWKQLVIGSSPEPYVSLDNCTIIGDAAADIHWRNVAPTMMNCILWGATGMLAGEQGEADISYSCIQGGYTGEGNISDDPLFRDPANGDYRFLPDSPCIDTGSTYGPSDDLIGNPRPVDIAGIGREATDAYDMGAYEFQEWELPVQTGVGNWNLYESQ